MELDIVNPHVVRIIISARPKDSIRAIAQRIGLSYGWTYKWAQELVKNGVFKKEGKSISLQAGAEFYKKTISYIKTAFSKNVSFCYSVLQLFGVQYCFTKTDAVFVWTKGGYNIARCRDHYPIFIKIRTDDKKTFDYYSAKLGLNKKKGVFYSAEVLDEFKIDRCDGVPVDPLSETIAFMQKNIYNFQPALEMIQEMYGKRLGVKYSEAVLNV